MCKVNVASWELRSWIVFTSSGAVGVVGEGSVATEATLLVFALDWQRPATRRVLA